MSVVLGGERRLLIDLESTLNARKEDKDDGDEVISTHIFHLMIYQKASI